MNSIPASWAELSTTEWPLAPCFGWIPPRSDTLVPSSSYSFLRSSPRQDWSSQVVDQLQDFLNRSRGTAISAIRNVTYRPRAATLAPILTSFSRKVVSDQCSFSLGVVHVFVAAEPSERGLAEEAGHAVLAILAGSGVDQPFTCRFGQTESVIQFPREKKPRIGSDLRAMEFQLKPTLEIKPQNLSFVFTHRVGHSFPFMQTITL
jgi:hypothetical protein